MKKLEEVVMKLANSVPNKPLAETQNSIIRDRFNRFFSLLHSPNHPPYAWMIERAIRELNEEGGSSEESISNFMKKEYDDLPWSHFTLLKHHLQALCKSGDIILIHSQQAQHYSLASADSTLNSGKKCRKKTRRKRGWDWEIKQRKRYRKDSNESLLQKEDQMQEKQNCMIEGFAQHNLEAEINKDTPILCILEEDTQQIEGDQTEFSVPERPPGFDHGILEESPHLSVSCRENSCQVTYPMRRPLEVMVSTAEGLSVHQDQIHIFNNYDQPNLEKEEMILSTYGTPETRVNQTLQDVQPVVQNDSIVMQQSQNDEHPAMPSQTRFVNLCSQKELEESEQTKNTGSASETEPVNLTGGRQVTRVVFKYQRKRKGGAKEKDLSGTTQEIKEDLLRELKCQGQKQSFDEAIASSLPQNELQVVKSVAANRSEHQELPEPSCEGQHDSEEINEVPDNWHPASSLLQHQSHEHEIADKNELQEVKSGTANRSKHQGLRSLTTMPCEEHLQSDACTEKDKFSVLPKPSELESKDIEQSFLTPRMQRQRKRWSTQLANAKRPQPKHRIQVESSQVTRDEVKLHSQEERDAEKLTVVLALSVPLKHADSQKFSKLGSFQKHSELEPRSQTSEHQLEEQVSKEKPSCRVLRPRPRKLEPSDALATAYLSSSHHQHNVQQQPQYSRHGRLLKPKPYGGVTIEEMVPYKPKHKRLGRPPKSRSVANTSISEKRLSETKQHGPKSCGRGTPRKAMEGE